MKIFFICITLSGCYSTRTTVFSGYDTIPHDKMTEKPSIYFEASPHIQLGNHLLINFINVPGKQLSPAPKTCTESSKNTISILAYSDKKYSIDLSKLTIRVKGKEYRANLYRKFKSSKYVSTLEDSKLPVGFMTSNFEQFKNEVNINQNDSYRKYVRDKSIDAGTSLQFDGKFSCGDNYYEMDLYFIDEESKTSEKYTIYFFPWKSSLTPH